MAKKLLILACSATKTPMGSGQRLPAVEVYAGPVYLTLRKLQRERPELFADVEILILSAEHGLIHSSTLIGTYDRRMDRARARELRESVAKYAAAFARNTTFGPFAETFIVAGEDYREALVDTLKLDELGERVTFAAGGIGDKRKHMREWLDGVYNG